MSVIRKCVFEAVYGLLHITFLIIFVAVLFAVGIEVKPVVAISGTLRRVGRAGIIYPQLSPLSLDHRAVILDAAIVDRLSPLRGVVALVRHGIASVILQYDPSVEKPSHVVKYICLSVYILPAAHTCLAGCLQVVPDRLPEFLVSLTVGKLCPGILFHDALVVQIVIAAVVVDQPVRHQIAILVQIEPFTAGLLESRCGSASVRVQVDPLIIDLHPALLTRI